MYMQDLLTPILARAEDDPMGAAQELGRGLMRGNVEQTKQGYSAHAAFLVVRDLIDLSEPADGSPLESELLAHLEGFALGMAEDNERTNPA